MADKKGTVIYIGGFELPDKNAAAHRVISNGKALRDLGYNVVFIGIDKSHKTNSVAEKEIFYGFECYKRKNPFSLLEWIHDFLNSNSYLRIINSYDDVRCIIAYNLPSLLLQKLKIFSKRNRLALFTDSTEWYDIKKKGNSLFKYLIRRLDVFIRMRVIQPRLDGVIAVSRYLYTYYANRGTNVIQVPPLVDLEDRKWADNISNSNNNNGILQIMYAGRPFSLYKEPSYKDRIDLIILALYELKKDGIPFFMHIIGVQKDEVQRNFPNLEVMINELGSSISFYGKVSHTRVIQILKRSDYSLFLRYNTRSVKAGFPTKFVESVSCGTPVLTNRISNVGDYLSEGVNGFFVDIASVQTIKESLKIPFSLNRAQLDQLKENCRTSNMFDYRKFIKSFKGFIEE